MARIEAADLISKVCAMREAFEDVGADLAAALTDVLTGRTPAKNKTLSIGCNLKWPAGNKPDYF